MCCASAPACSPAIVATTWRGRSLVSCAHSATAPRERSQPSRAARRSTSLASSSPALARSSSRNEPRRFCSTSSLASSTATSVSEATAARCRNSVASGETGAPGSPSISTQPIASSPDAIGTSASTPGGTWRGPVARALADVAAQHRQVGRPAARARRGAEPRHDDRDDRSAGVRGQLRDAPEAVAAQHRVHHLEVDGPQPLDEPGAGGLDRLGAGHAVPRRPAQPRPRPPGAPAASPRRTRRCGSGRPRRPAARTPCRRRSSRCARA